MKLDPFGAILKAALLAGVVSGLLVAAAQFVWTEPLIDRAISVEEQLHASDRSHAAAEQMDEAPPMVDRPTQKKGLFLGYAIYGIAWGLLFGAAYAIAQPNLPASWSRAAKALLTAAASYWAVGLLPFLKYPANPPGVGDPDTIGFRQRLYLAMLIAGIFIVAGTFTIVRRAGPRLGGRATALAIVWTGIASAAVFFALPGNPDAIRAPMPLVMDFRWHSAVGLTLFWALLGTGFGLALDWLASRECAPATAHPAAPLPAR